MGLFSSSKSTDDSHDSDRPRVEVHTNHRSYSWFGPRQVTWEKGEKVVSAESKGGKK